MTEASYTGYVVRKSGDSGTILGDKIVTASFINIRNTNTYGIIPKTGDTNSGLGWGLEILTAAAVAIGTFLSGKRKKSRSK